MTVENNEPRKPVLTLDQAVKYMQAAWTKFRDAQLYAFHAAVPVLEFARANEDDFRVYCQDRSVKGDLPETQVVELLIQDDPDADAISRERRAEYGAVIGWFATWDLCPETDADKAVQLAKQKGRMKGVAALYRRDRDAEKPEAEATKAKVKATKAAKAAEAKLRASAAANSTDTETHVARLACDSNGPEVNESVFNLCGDATDAISDAREESTGSERYAHSRTELAAEFIHKLDQAGVPPYSPENLLDLGVGLFLVIRDQPSGRPRMFEIVETDANCRLLVDTIIKRHAAQTRLKTQTA